MHQCQSSEGTLHIVALESMSEKMLDVAKKLVDPLDPSLFFCLNTIPNASDTRANDVQYQLTCWVDIKRQAKHDSINLPENVDIDRVPADIKMLTQ